MFPDIIQEVVFQINADGLYQFSCVPDGNYEKSISSEQVIELVNEALFNYVNDNYVVPKDMLYFNSIDYFTLAEDYCQVETMYFSLQKTKQTPKSPNVKPFHQKGFFILIVK